MVGVNGPRYAPPSGSMYSKGMQFQGAGGNTVNKYQTLGNTGLTKAEVRSQGDKASKAHNTQELLEKQPERQAFCAQYGIDASAFDYNGDGLIGKKEFKDIQSAVQRYMSQNMYQNQNGQSVQGGNAFGLLNSLGGEVMGAITGNEGNSSGSSGGGSFLNQAAGWVKGIFG